MVATQPGRESPPMNERTSTRLTYRELSLLGLKEHPFHPSADPRFLYLSRNHLNILGRLQDLVEWREGLAVVEGHMGTGKTSLARRLYELTEQDERVSPVYIHTAAFKTPMDAARDISAAFGVRGRRSYLDQLRDLESHLVALRRESKTAVVLLDDAQFMQPDSLDTIQNMLNFDLSEKLVQIVLFGQQEIKGLFVQKKAVHDRVVHWQSLGPLPFSEMVGLINFRLTVAGRAEPLFTDSALTRLFDFSGGIPRPLVIVCGNTLRLLAEKKSQSADTEVVEEAIRIYEQRPGRQP
jgi:general secretion pathway protein A